MTAAAVADPTPAEVRGALRFDEPMARHTVWGVGGPADRFFEPADVDDLAVFLASVPAGEPLFWLGLGSNLLVRDGGISGTVIRLSRLDGLRADADGAVLAEAGVPTAKLARFAARRGLLGAEFLAGIPGTLGGALAMNAGAFGGETWALIQSVRTLDRHGVLRTRTPEDFQVGYRRVVGPEGEWFVAAQLVLKPGAEPAAAEARIRERLRLRAESQPTGERSCGSVFRNPDGDHAGRLVDECGLKGRRIGGAVVSEKHANFILNTGDASAADIETLIETVADTVHRACGVRLVPEVRIVGRAEGRR